MAIIVKKFGGTSVADQECIRKVATIIKESQEKGEQVVAVVSAMAGATKNLTSKCQEMSDLKTKEQLREYDAALATGEVLTAALLALELDRIGVPSKSLQGWQVPLKANMRRGEALVKWTDPTKLRGLIELGVVPVVTGFQAVNEEGDITTLGKGGSDTTAALITACLGSKRCEIYTDVDGIYSADPRICQQAKQIHHIPSKLLYLLALKGAKVLHPRAALAAVRYGFNLQIKSTFEQGQGTNMTASVDDIDIAIVTSDENILICRVEASTKSHQILTFLTEHNIKIKGFTRQTDNIELIADLTDQPKVEIACTLMKEDGLIKEPKYITDQAIVTIVGEGVGGKKKYINKLTDLLSEAGVPVFAVSDGVDYLSFWVDKNSASEAVRIVHERVSS